MEEEAPVVLTELVQDTKSHGKGRVRPRKVRRRKAAAAAAERSARSP